MGQGIRVHARATVIAITLWIATSLWSTSSTLLASLESDQPAEARSVSIYQPGGDVKSPKLVHYVEPEFASTSEKAFVEGTVKVMTVVTDQGMPTQIRVVEGLNDQEDKAAIEAVRQWRFNPGTKAGKSVNVRVIVQIAFHLL